MPSAITFGDKVRILTTPETTALGLAGRVGQVYGETTPSATGVSVVGQPAQDYALNVHFEGQKDTFWFAAELLEFVDHSPGTEIQLGGTANKWVRSETGEWVIKREKKKAWWRLWE